MDEHLAHYAALIVNYLSPKLRKGRSIKPERMQRYRRVEEEDDESATVEEREDYITDHLARIGAPKVGRPKVA